MSSSTEHCHTDSLQATYGACGFGVPAEQTLVQPFAEIAASFGVRNDRVSYTVTGDADSSKKRKGPDHNPGLFSSCDSMFDKPAYR